MDNFETNLLKNNKHPLIKNIKFWYRYVDDIICFWSGTDRQLEQFLSHLNSLHKNIKFTTEKEQESKLNFLDLTITRKNNKFLYNIYRKDTYSDAVIPFDSDHHPNTKAAAFHSMIHRLINIPLSIIDFNSELNTIYHIAKNNGYNKFYINKILNKKQRNKNMKLIYTPSTPKSNDKNYRKLLFTGKISFKISRKLKTYNIQPAFYNKNNIKSLLVINKIQNSNKLLNSGVYKIHCNDCNYFYIGKTTRNFGVRFKEHLNSWRLNRRDTSNVAKHLLQYNHKCTIDNLEIMHKENKGLRLDILEAMEIQRAIKNNENLMNEQLDLYNSPLLRVP